MDEQNFISREETRLREKQDRCEHPSLKCSLCGLYKDNLCNEQKAEIDLLHIILEQYEGILTIHNIPFTCYRHVIKSDTIKTAVKIKLREYISHRSKTDEQ